jgi:hypothetical protein
MNFAANLVEVSLWPARDLGIAISPIGAMKAYTDHAHLVSRTASLTEGIPTAEWVGESTDRMAD